MIHQQGKRKNPETGKVDADYYIGDVKNQRKFIINFVQALNSQKKPGEPQHSAEEAVRKMGKRIAKHFGYDNKYRGDGSLRE